jgi:hypothetical protein
VVYEFSEEIAERICDWLAEGRSLRSFCFQDGTPIIRTAMRWLDADAAFAQRYACGRDRGKDVMAELATDEAT